MAHPYFDDVREAYPPLPPAETLPPFPSPPTTPNTGHAAITRRWITTVCTDFRMSPHIEPLAISIFDQSRKKIVHLPINLQVCACASMYIASVVLSDEIDIPDLVTITNRTVSEERIKLYVQDVLASCSFQVCKTTSYDVLLTLVEDVPRNIAGDSLTLLQFTYSTDLAVDYSAVSIAYMCLVLAKNINDTHRSLTPTMSIFIREICERIPKIKLHELRPMARMDSEPFGILEKLLERNRVKTEKPT